MINPKSYSNCSEFYEVVKSVEFVKNIGGEDRYLRIDALFHPQAGTCSTAAYIRESVTLQPTYPQSQGQFDRKAENMEIWAVYSNIGWTSRATPEEAIEQALGFLN